MMSERQEQILVAIVEEYIKSATPVSSGAIFDVGNFEVSCPTIRNEMAALTEQGYLLQPHTSAGRIPTEQGYRFFVDECIQRQLRNARANSFCNIDEDRRKVRKYAQEIAARANDVVLFIDEENEIQYLGLKKAFAKPEFEDREAILSFIEELERLETSLFHAAENLRDGMEIFIGSENPFFEDDRYSMIISPIGEGYISIVGPMRMNYQKNLLLLQGL